MSQPTQRAEIMVIGAGIVGLACAWHLQRQGFEVTLVDPEPPGAAASSGNAGLLANFAIEPLAHPMLWREMPHLLLSPHSPFHLRWRHLPGLAPWLWRFMQRANRRSATQATQILSELLAPSIDDWRHIIGDLEDTGDLLQQRGSLCFYLSAKGWHEAQAEFTERERFGIKQERLDARALAELEPALEGLAQGGILFPDACHVSDPLTLAQRLAERLKGRGVQLVRARAQGLASHAGGVGIDTDQGPWQAEKVVIAAGAWSRSLALAAGDRIPLISERGYHLEFSAAKELVSRPCSPGEYAFYLTPMQGRLRIAGTVELGHNDDPANPRRLDYIRRHAESLFGPLGEPSHTWLGLRPSLPDSLPVIGPASSLPGVGYAFGHGHLGLTLAATTGRLLAASIKDEAPDWLKACSATRFR
ncbi:FAD-binding oxidoreductase [Halomonas sp. MCCC 1A17488]|uniref:NAD(P)/FAD-dependent oxidoreductase n=1 Tax=unclassified Halomonas TaxID=2609666 RepID=UPI0018D2020B|nr:MULTISPECIES: FAD-dependent oxidoreductase [unclassified Halomonas]MCE8017635.1 FAD-binding oxidoreductase [Halomonas sp. MCCC 1A17488]MCG3240968.1 FAD-binding oxidoreductase [Halomonas sp. MCCC 1A17488]QPP48838.1 FAD-binding oxidoreductase [Halomonas sp. SS10-MC5]